MAITVGSNAPPYSPVPGAPAPPRALIFYKVTCPTCQMSAPALDRFERAYPGMVTGIGQDPEGQLEAFSREYGVTFPSIPDLPPYEVSNAYRVESVPTMVVIDANGVVADVVESWDREGYNRASATLASLLGARVQTISDPSDGLPDFRP